jgi:choline dehydrogenase-like flavoprotein
MTTLRRRVDVAVVGSGPGGATVARELTRAGKRVLLLERGRDWRRSALYGTYPGALLYADKHALLFTREGINIIRPLMLGGATSMFAGCSAPPLPWWQAEFGIDLEPYAAETVRELGIAPLAAELRGEASTRIAEAGRALGMDWTPQDKFMQPQRSPDFDCGAKCMLGCRCGAKWNAAEFVDQAVIAGCELWTEARVDRILTTEGHVGGLEGRRKGEDFRVEADTVVVAAGGIGSAVLLRQSGLDDAGRGMTMDSTVMVYGRAPFKGTGEDPPMTWSCPDDELGVLYSTLIDPWLMYPLIMALKGPTHPFSWYRWGRTLGVMIKVGDELSGEVFPDGSVSKGFTARDTERLRQAEAVAGDVLRRTGCEPASIVTTPARGTHPSGTVRVGDMLSTDLETRVRGLYVCDASVFPRALARPTVLTIIALAKRLSEHLVGRPAAARAGGRLRGA